MEEVKRTFEVVSEVYLLDTTEGQTQYLKGQVIMLTDAQAETALAQGTVVEVPTKDVSHLTEEEQATLAAAEAAALNTVARTFRVVADWNDIPAGTILGNEFFTGKTIAVDELVADGVLEEVVLPTGDTPIVETPADVQVAPVVEAEPVVETPAPKVYRYNGSDVVSNSVRMEGGKEYHHIQLTTGESLDISDAEYEAMINA